MEAGPHRGTRGGKGPRARLFNTLQQIVVDEYKRQNRRFRWVRFADASKQQIEALFSWRESLDSWHLWDFDQEAFEVIQAADNAYQQRLASVETAGVVLPQGVQSQDKAAASGAAEAASSAADWLRPPSDASFSFILATRFAHSIASHPTISRGKTSVAGRRQDSASRGVR